MASNNAEDTYGGVLHFAKQMPKELGQRALGAVSDKLRALTLTSCVVHLIPVEHGPVQHSQTSIQRLC